MTKFSLRCYLADETGAHDNNYVWDTGLFDTQINGGVVDAADLLAKQIVRSLANNELLRILGRE